MFRLITLIFLLLILGFQIHAQEITYKRTIDIVSKKDTTINYKAHDLVVIQGNGRYQIELFFKQGKMVLSHLANIKSETFFNKASYKRISDNAAAIRLFDSKSINEYKL